MARIIEATAVISGRAGDMSGFAKVASQLSAVSKAGQQVRTALAGAGTDLGKRVEEISSKLARIDNFRTMSRGLDEAALAMKRAQQDAAKLKTALDAAGETATRKMQADYARAAAAVDRATQAFRSQGQAVRDARAALNEAGIPVNRIAKEQAHLAASLDKTTAAMQRQAQTGRSLTGGRAPVYGTPHATSGAAPAEGGGMTVLPMGMKAAGALGAAYLAKRAHGEIVEQHHDFQQSYLTQQAILGLDKEGQKSLLDQAEKIGKDTKFTNADIVRAQTDIGAKLPKEMQKPDIIQAITEHTKNYALAMKVSMEEGAEAMVGYMKSWGYDLSSPEAAAASAKRASNMLVEFAKTTGAKHHDIVGSTKFGAAPSRVGGFSEELSKAIEAQLIRVGYEGAMAGTFSRAVATKLAVPSRQGAAAIAGAGIDFGEYRKPGKDASAEGLSEMLRQRFGRGLNSAQTKALQAILDDPEVMADKGLFSEKTSELLNSTFARKTKKGTINAQDAERITKTTDQFYNVVSEGVDTPRLFMDLLRKGLTPALARYLFGQEHGGRAIGLDPKAIERDEKEFRNMPDNRASVVAEKQQEGAQGEWNKMVGSVQTFTVAIGEATDASRAFTYKGIGALFDYMTDLVKGKATNPITALPNAMREAGAIAAGKYYSPTDPDGFADLRQQIADGNAKIASIQSRIHPSMRGNFNPEIDLLQRQIADMRNRIDIGSRGWVDASGAMGERGRGVAQPQLEAVVKPDQITAKAEVSGAAKVEVVIQPSAAFQGLISGAQAAAQMQLKGNGPGSTGASMPEAAAPNTGAGNPMGPR